MHLTSCTIWQNINKRDKAKERQNENECFPFNLSAAWPTTKDFLISEQGLTIFDFRSQTNQKSLFVNPRLSRAGLFVNRVPKTRI